MGKHTHINADIIPRPVVGTRITQWVHHEESIGEIEDPEDGIGEREGWKKLVRVCL